MPPMWIDQDDMVNTYGKDEIVQLTDRNEPLLEDVNEDVLNANIDDAEAEILTQLSTAYLPSEIKKVYDADKKIPIINHWAKVVTRAHLYSSLENDDSQVTKAYDDYKLEIEAACKSGSLVDSDGNVIPKKSNFYFIEDDGCCRYDPCCGYFKDHL